MKIFNLNRLFGFGDSETKKVRNQFDGAGQRRRLSKWQPTDRTVNSLIASDGERLRRRARDIIRNNAHATSAVGSFAANLIGTGIKPSSLITNPELRKKLMELWDDWCNECDADGVQNFYGLQELAARALFEAGECFIRFRPRLLEDGYVVPLQIQLLESEMVPYSLNRRAENGNYIMNGIELDFRGKRVAYYFFNIHPGDSDLEPDPLSAEYTRVPAEEVLHVFNISRPGQMRGVPMLTSSIVRMFLLDSYDDAELERKRTAALYAGFIKSPEPDFVVPVDPDNPVDESGQGLVTLEPGTMQQLLPGEDLIWSQPADVGGSYEMWQYRQQLAIFSAMGVPYTLASGDLKRANYSSLRGAIIEYRRRLSQIQDNKIIHMMSLPIWNRFMDAAVLAAAIAIEPKAYNDNRREFVRARHIPPKFELVDPLKEVQADKMSVDAGFKSRSDVVESYGYDPEENDQRIAADKQREKDLGLEFLVVKAASSQPGQEAAAAPEDVQQAAEDAADEAAA